MKLTTSGILQDYPVIQHRISARIMADSILNQIMTRDDPESLPGARARATQIIATLVEQLTVANQGAAFWNTPVLPMGGKIRTNAQLEPVEPPPDDEDAKWKDLLGEGCAPKKRRMRGRVHPLPQH